MIYLQSISSTIFGHHYAHLQVRWTVFYISRHAHFNHGIISTPDSSPRQYPNLSDTIRIRTTWPHTKHTLQHI